MVMFFQATAHIFFSTAREEIQQTESVQLLSSQSVDDISLLVC
jgi:hypothetical protein